MRKLPRLGGKKSIVGVLSNGMLHEMNDSELCWAVSISQRDNTKKSGIS